MTALEAFDVYRFFHTRESETLALRGVSLRIEAGEMVALMGPSGSGKSTLLACWLDEPDGGHVELLGERFTRLPEADRARRRAASVGMLMQSGNLFQTLTVRDNVKLSMLLAHKMDHARAEHIAANNILAAADGGQVTFLDFDAVINGAGFSGMCMLHSLRDKLDLNVVFEAGGGGTWYWNRYPGARCDSDSYVYCYTFDKNRTCRSLPG